MDRLRADLKKFGQLDLGLLFVTCDGDVDRAVLVGRSSRPRVGPV